MIRLSLFAVLSIWSVSALAKLDDSYTKAEQTCLALNIYHEARGEAPSGQMAVAMVTMNRLANPKYPKSVCGVVYQTKQFSWTGDKILDVPKDLQAWGSAKRLAAFVYEKYPRFHRQTRGAIDITRGAVHYYAPKYANPQWAQHKEVTREIGAHRFMRAKG